jgi:(2Fe-2S) ferredoxin
MSRFERHIFICTNERPPENPTGCCATKGGDQVRAAFKSELKRRKLNSLVRANRAGCLANCSHGVSIVVYPEAVWYGGVTLKDVDEIIEEHLIGGKVVNRLLLKEYSPGPFNLEPLKIPESVAALQRRSAAGDDPGK